MEAQHNEQEVEKLHAKIGQLAIENDFLSKAFGTTADRAPGADPDDARAPAWIRTKRGIA